MSAELESLVNFIRATYSRETSAAGDRVLAQHGDVPAARRLLAEFREAFFAGRFGVANQDDASLLIETNRLIARVLAQPDRVLGAALGIQNLRRWPENLLRDRIIYFAVEHVAQARRNANPRAPENMAACYRSVADAMDRLSDLFPAELTVDRIKEIYDDIVKGEPKAIPDPMGPGVPIGPAVKG